MSRSILLLNWRDIKNQHAGGAEVFAHEIAKRLIMDGFQVTWFASRGKGQLKEEVVDGINIIRRGSWITVYLWAFFYYVLKVNTTYSHVIDCQNGIPFFSPIYSRSKIICVIHHVHRQVFKGYSPNFFIKYVGILLESLIPLVYRKSSIVAVSPSTKEALERNLGVKTPIEIIYNGVDHYLFRPGKKSDDPLIIYLGRLKKYKKVGDLIEAFAQIKNRIPKAKLVIVGSGEEGPVLKNISNERGLAVSVSFEGFVSSERKVELLQKSWVLVYPSMCEGWGISILEANACATAAIGSDVAGLRDSIKNGHTGLLYPLSDTKELAKSLFDILTNDSMRHDMEINAQKWAAQFDWNKSYEKIKSILIDSHV